MTFKFEKLEVWQMSLDYVDLIYQLSNSLPESERFNLKSQIERAATSISLNIAEGSTGQTNPEQARFLGMALRSLLETVACLRIIVRRKYIKDEAHMEKIDLHAQELARKISAFRRAISPQNRSIGEKAEEYDIEAIQ
jgi:four helix bundle protein